MHREFEHANTPRGRRLHMIDLILTRGLYLVTAVVVTMATVVIITRQNDTHRVLRQITDCTTPHHRCYDSGRAQTQLVVQQLLQYQEIVAWCANRPQNKTLVQVQRCVASQPVPKSP